MIELEIHPAAQVRLKGQAWLPPMPRTEFRLLSVLLRKPGRIVSFRELHWQVWEMFDAPRESCTLARSRRILIDHLKPLAPEVKWDEVIRRDPAQGYGIFLSDG
jgi:DNA-binding response OmpR family regulator